MISNPDLIQYACIARKNTILAEFARNSDLETLARRCIVEAPPYHSMYTHTVRRRSYTFLIDEPIVLFAISDELLGQSECLRFLNRLKSAFENAAEGARASWRRRSEESLFAAGSFQPELDSVMREIAASASSEKNSSSVNSTPSLSSVSQGTSADGSGAHSLGFTPLLGSKLCKGLNFNLKKKKKNRLSGGEPNGGDLGNETFDNAVDGSDEIPPPQKSGSVAAGDWQKAKHVWKKHVWVVLTLDLFVCAILFGIWLWVCRGFKCIEN